MYETEAAAKVNKATLTESLASVPQTIDRKLPSMDKRIGEYLDGHIKHLISEWGLVTRFTIENLEHRLETVSSEISGLEKEKVILKDRASAFEKALREVEEG